MAKLLFLGGLTLILILIFPFFLFSQITDDLVFIHHSCGNNWLNGGLHNALLGKDYIDERNDIYYGTTLSPDSGRPSSLGGTPGDNTNMDHWILWFNDYLDGVKGYGCADGFNRIIMFKSCYPASNIGSDGTEPGDPFSSTMSLANYRAVYRKYNDPGGSYLQDGYYYQPLEDVFAQHPEVLFIPVTAPPRHYAPSDATNDAEAQRARDFNNWLKNDWLSSYNASHPGLDNVAVYDWFNYLAYPADHASHPNRLKQEYGGESGNSHPNSTANQESTTDFASGTDNFIDTTFNAWQSGGSPTPTPAPSPSPSPTAIVVDPWPAGSANEIGGGLPSGYEPSGVVWHDRLDDIFLVSDDGWVSWMDQSGDLPRAFDYDGDGTANRTLFRSSTGTWYIYQVTTIRYGLEGDRPVAGSSN